MLLEGGEIMNILSPIEYDILDCLAKTESGYSSSKIAESFGEDSINIVITLNRDGYINFTSLGATDNWRIAERGRAALLNKKSVDELQKGTAIKGWVVGFLTGITTSIIGMIIKYFLF